MKIAVVAVGYNRPNLMRRLLSSISNADYCGDVVDLVVSIDKGERQAEIVEVANKVVWEYGDKHIRAFSEKQGLCSHILQCGRLAKKYDAVIVLEDDLIVARGFYSYCKQMIEYYDSDGRIAGISLYKHRIAQGVVRPFDEAESTADVFFMQIAQSWGQCWTSRMWSEFERWYESNNGEILSDETFPQYVAAWDRSWLKYNMKYVVDNDKYFVYPHSSLTTNHSDVGEHCEVSSNDYQVPMLEGVKNYRCCPLEDGIKYDIFFERMGIEDKIFPELKGKKLLDLNGGRKLFGNADYLFSVQALPYRVIKEIRHCYRPLEFNLLNPIEGKGIFVYDLHTKAKPPKRLNNLILSYDLRCLTWRRAIKYLLVELPVVVRRKLGFK